MTCLDEFEIDILGLLGLLETVAESGGKLEIVVFNWLMYDSQYFIMTHDLAKI